MEVHLNDNTVPDFPLKQVLPRIGGRTSVIVDNDYLAHIHAEGDDRIHLCFGNKEIPFNCVRIANCEVLNGHVRSITVFAHNVIIDDVDIDCEDIYFNLRNELEVRGGNIRFSTMKVDAKWANIERPSILSGNHLFISASQSTSLSGGFHLKNQIVCRSQQISIDKHCTITCTDLLLLPTKILELRGILRIRKLFIGDFNEKLTHVTNSTAKVKISGDVEGDRVSVMTLNEIVLSGSLSVNEMDCSSGNDVKVEGVRLKVKKLNVHAHTTRIDAVSVLEGSELSFLVEDKIVVGNLSSFQFDCLLAIECRSLVCEGQCGETLAPAVSKFRCGEVYVTATESIDIGGVLKCKKLILRCQQHSTNVLIRENAKFDVDSLLVFGNTSTLGGDSNGGESSRSGEIVFDGGSVVRCSLFVAIEADKEVVMMGSMERDLCYAPTLSINTSKSIKFVNCSVDVGESQLLFGDELILESRAKVCVSGKLFLLHHRKQTNTGILRLAKDCVLVARKDIVCQFGECYVEGTLASEEESVLLGRNDNQGPSRAPEGTEKKDVKIHRLIKQVVRSLKPTSNPLSSLFKKIQEKRIELIQSFQRIIHWREEDAEQKSFVMEYIFISGEVRARKTVMLVSRDISIQNGSSIKCTSVWDNTAILMYSNRSVFQCSSELDASTVLIVSPIVFQLLSLIKAHNLSISAAAIFRLACLCNSTKTILKSPMILSGLNVVAPNVSKTLHKMRSDLVESCVDVVMLIERLSEARIEHRAFAAFLVESMNLFKKHSHLAMLHSLEFVHVAFQIVNLLVPKTALIITMNVMSIFRAAMFLMFSVKSIRKSIKRYLTSERQNFILVEIVGEAMFSLYQVVGVVTSFTSLYNQIKGIRSSGMNSSRVDIPTLKDLPRTIFNRTRDLVSSGPLSALSSVLGVLDTFVLNDYTKYAVGLFSYLPSSMRFSILNLSGEMQLGMYVVNNSSTCSLNGSVVVLSYNCSSSNLVSFNPRSNVVICNGGIYEMSTIGKVDRGVKISQRSLMLAGGRRVHDGGFHFGESVLLKTKKLYQQDNNRMMYRQIGGFSVKEWKLQQSVFRPVSSSESRDLLFHNRSSVQVGGFGQASGGDYLVDESVFRSGNEIESVSVGSGSTFFLKNLALKINNVSGAVTLENVHMKLSGGRMTELLNVQVAGGSNSLVSDARMDVDFSIQLANDGLLSIVSPSTNINCETNGEGHVALQNAEIGANARIQHAGSTFLELKDELRLTDVIVGRGKYSNIANQGLVNVKVNGEFVVSANDDKTFNSETSIRENQDLGIIADSIDICRDVVRNKAIRLFSVEEDVIVRKSVTSKDGSVVIKSQKGNVIVEDSVEKGFIVTKCHLETQQSLDVNKSRLEKDDGSAAGSISSFYQLTVVEGVVIVKNVEKVELRAKDSVVIMANQGSVILDPCVIHGDESVVLQGKTGVSIKDICVTSVSHKGSRNPFYSKRKKVIKGVVETTRITSGGDITLIASEGMIVSSGASLISSEGRIFQSGRDGVVNESSVAEVFIKEKKRVFGGLSREERKEKHEVETPCVFESTEGIYLESEKGSIVNVGVVVTGSGVCSFKAGENVLFERRILKHEVSVKKQGFDLSLSILGADIFESSSTFFENLKLEFLENHLPPIGSSPIEVARSIREGNVPEIAANLVNALLVPGNLRFFLDAPVKFGLKFSDYDLHRHKYESLGEGKVEMDHLYVKAANTVEFSNSFGFNAGSVEIEAHKLIDHGAFLNYEVENFSSGLGFSFEPFGGNLSQCIPSLSADLSVAKESCSIAVCQVGNSAFVKVNVDEWDKSGSQTFAETIEGRVGTVLFDSTSTVTEGKRHGISLGTTSLGLSDGHSKSSLIADQTGLYAVNVDGLMVETVSLKSSRCPVRGTDSTMAEESMEFEKVSGTSLGIDFSGFLSFSGMAIAAKLGGGKQISKLKGVGIEKKDYLAVVENSFASVSESEFHYRAIDSYSQNDVEREAMSDLELEHQTYRTLSRNDNSLFVNKSETVDPTTSNRTSALLTPAKNVLKDRSFNLKVHYDRDYHLLRDGVEQMHKEVVDEGLLPCLEGAAFEDVDTQLLYPVLDIFYDPSTSELDKYTQMLFYRDGEKSRFCDLSESEKQEVFIYQSYLQSGGDFRDFISLCNFYDEKKQSLSDDYAKKSMKEYVRETYPELYLSTGLHDVQNIDEVQRIFMDIKFAYEPDDPMVRQLTFEMDQYYAEQMFEASWAELSSAQQKEIVKIREHALMYQQTDQEVDFGEYLHAKEAQFVDYFANHHQEPDTNVLTSFGVLPIELLKEPDPILSECMPYESLQPFDNERKYPAPGSGLFFLPAPPEKGGWEGICEYGSTIKNCIRDHFSYFLAGRPEVDYQPSEMEVFRDKSLRSFVSGVLNFIPYVNGAKWGYQGIAGFDPITKDLLDWKERVIDLTFSMFYFTPVANVIIGYGKGAVLEPLKGTWVAGKIIVKDRTLKGVFETMKITGSAAIESISVPTQHLGAFLEMKMMWGVNNGAASLRSASSWVSGKMRSWKAGFWNKWNQSKRHFDVVASRVSSSYAADNLAFAGGVPTVNGNGLGVFNNNQSFMRSTMDVKPGGFSNVRKGGSTTNKGNEKVAKGMFEQSSIERNSNMKKGSNDIMSDNGAKDVMSKIQKTHEGLFHGLFIPGCRKASAEYLEMMGSKYFKKVEHEQESTLLDLLSEKIYSKLGRTREIVRLPRLSGSEYKGIANRLNSIMLRKNKDPRITEPLSRTDEHVKSFRRKHRKEIVEEVRRKCDSSGDGLGGFQMLERVRRLPDEYSDFLVDLISIRIHQKLPPGYDLRNLDRSKALEEGSFRLSSKDLDIISRIYHADPRVRDNPQYSRSDEQIRFVKTHTKRLDILRRVRQLRGRSEISHPLTLDTRLFIPKECSYCLVDIMANELLNTIPKHWDVGMLKVDDLPLLTSKDYEKITKLYNAHPVVKVNPGCERSIKQLEHFRRNMKRAILMKVKEKALISAKRERGNFSRKKTRASYEKSHTLSLPIEYQRTLLNEIYKELSVSMPVNKKGITKLTMPGLCSEQYVAIAKRYNADSKVMKNPKFERNVAQVEIFRSRRNKMITKEFSELMLRKNGIQIEQYRNKSRKLSEEHRTILLGIMSKVVRDKMPKHSNLKKLDVYGLPRFVMDDYEKVAELFNSHPGVSDEFHRTAIQMTRLRTEFLFQIVKTIRGEQVSMTKFRQLPTEFRSIIFDEVAEVIYSKNFEKFMETAENFKNGLPKLELNDYEVIAKHYNDNSRVVNTLFERPVEYFYRQLRTMRSWQREILKRVQALCAK